MAGPRLTLLLCLIVPLTLSLPTALMAAELTALMPVEGGFYFWVKEALGPFAGFAEAYLTILYTAVDMAIYPVLFAGYLSFILPLGPASQIAIGIALVWLAGGLNFLGVRPVGMASIILAAMLVSPFAILVIVGLPHLIHFTMPTPPLFGADPWAALAAGLTVVIWNFGGWENLSVVSAEIENPRRNYLRAILIAMPIIVAGYLLPLAVSVSGATTAADWGTGSFSHVGNAHRRTRSRRRAGDRRRGDVVRGVRSRDALGLAHAVRPRARALPVAAARTALVDDRDAGQIDPALLHRLHAAGAGRIRSAGSARRLLLHGGADARAVRTAAPAQTDARSHRHVHNRRRPHRPRIDRNASYSDLGRNFRIGHLSRRRQDRFHPGNRRSAPWSGQPTQSAAAATAARPQSIPRQPASPEDARSGGSYGCCGCWRHSPSRRRASRRCSGVICCHRCQFASIRSRCAGGSCSNC